MHAHKYKQAKKKHRRNRITYLHQFMDVLTDEFMGGDRRQAL